VVRDGQTAEFEGAHAQAVALAAVLDPAELDQLLQDAVRRGPGEPGALRQLGERESRGRCIEGVEDQRHALDHRDRRLAHDRSLPRSGDQALACLMLIRETAEGRGDT
jgi:hypothetical protein